MTKGDIKILEEALANPKRVFGVPENVVADNRLKKEDRLLILQNWERHAIALEQDEIPPAELLRRIYAAKLKLIAAP
jgi:hypothetical protein